MRFYDHQFGKVKGSLYNPRTSKYLAHLPAADNQQITRAAFIDFAKAFDVDHQFTT